MFFYSFLKGVGVPIPSWVKMIGLWQGLLIAGVLIGLALFVAKRGILNTVLWLVGILAAGVGVVNRLSYGN